MDKLSDKLNLRNDFPETTYEEWKKVVEKDLKGAPFGKKLITKTYEEINLSPIYTQEDLDKIKTEEAFPGFYNYIRGSNAGGYHTCKWNIAQELSYASAEELNVALRHDLERGQYVIYFTPDKATLKSNDPDNSSKVDVGMGGTSLVNISDLSIALKNIELNKYSVYINAGFSVLPLMSMLIAYAKEYKIDTKNLKGKITTDPIAYSLENGTLPVDFKTAFDEMASALKWCIDNKSGIKTIGINGLPYINSGASSVQELGYVMSTAVEFINQMLSRGFKIDDIAPYFHLNLGIGTFYFMEVAKLRAARILWAKIIQAYGGIKESEKISIHAKSSNYNQTKYDIYVNMLRNTTQAFSAIVGGADSISTYPFDSTLGAPDEFSRRIARNTQIILNEESHLGHVIDPAGGSYYIESLTVEVAKRSWELFQSVEKDGRMLKSVEKGIPQSAIKKVAGQKKSDIAKRKSILVGNNAYANMTEDKPVAKDSKQNEFFKKRVENIKKYRSEKRKSSFAELSGLSGTELMNSVIDAFAGGATIGEVSRSLHGRKKSIEIPALDIHRASEMFEELRDASFAYKEKNGHFPKVFLSTIGPLKQHKARADFARGFFETGGFDVIYEKGFNTPAEAVSAAAASGAKIIVICSTDDTYPELVPAIAGGIKSKAADAVIILAGYPKEQIEEHKKSGVDDFIFTGADAYALLKKLIDKLNQTSGVQK
ncbi:methylmalonyl-CoA mutase [bacterium]|nr:MAG: methylmalonyl-CoA mutase [bacterium]